MGSARSSMQEMLVAEPDKALTGGIRTALDPIEAITEGPQIENETELTSANHTYNHTLGVSFRWCGPIQRSGGGCYWEDCHDLTVWSDSCRHECIQKDW